MFSLLLHFMSLIFTIKSLLQRCCFVWLPIILYVSVELSQQWRWSIFLIMSAYRVNSPWIAYTTRHASNDFIMMPVLVSENIIRLYRVIVDRWTLILWVSILSNAVSKRKLLLLVGCSLLISKLDYGLYMDYCVCDTCVLWRWCYQE